jgi:tetratricopeptide (TPR) repeat protein
MFCLPGRISAQDQRAVDSLVAVVETKAKGERFSLLFELAFEYIQKDNQSALNWILRAEQEALSSGDSLSIVKSMRVKGQLMYLLEDIDEAKNVFLKVLPMAVRNEFNREVLFIQVTLSKIFLFQGNYDSALNVNFNALALAGDLKNDVAKRDILYNIGIAYYKLKNYKKGLDYFLQSLQLFQQTSAQPHYVLSNIGLCYFYLGDLLRSRAYIKKSLDVCGSKCPVKLMINIEYAFGLISRGEKQTRLAEKHFLESYNLAKLNNDTRFQFDNVYFLSQIYIERKQFKKSEFYLSEAERLIKRGTPFNLEKIKIYSQFAELYRTTGNHRASSNYQYKYIQLKDSIYNEELTNNLMRTEADFLERENKARILAQQEVIALKEEIIHRKSIVNILAIAVGIIMSIFLITILKSYRDKKNMNILLDRKVEERTRELHDIRNELLHALGERDARISHTLKEIAETVNNIRGLCFLGMKDVSEPVALSYMRKIDKVTSRLAS